jgi:hypothetical protein
MTVPALQLVMGWALYGGPTPIYEFTPDQVKFPPFTDDRAPVEYMIDTMIFREATR